MDRSIEGVAILDRSQGICLRTTALGIYERLSNRCMVRYRAKCWSDGRGLFIFLDPFGQFELYWIKGEVLLPGHLLLFKPLHRPWS